MKNVAQIFLIVALLILGITEVSAQSRTQPQTESQTQTPPTRSKKKKKDKDLSGFDLRYQDMIARYNRYFNATIRYWEGTTKLVEDNEDSYQEVLTVYPFNGGEGTGASTELNAVVEKTNAMIQIRPYSKWVDDAYLLLGKASFLMGDYDRAIKSFKYINSQYSNEIRKKPPVVSKKKRTKKRAKDRKAEKKQRAANSEAQKKERAKAKKERDKEKAKAKKETQKERAAADKERDAAKKEELKKREEAAKERDKEKKETLKERAASKKERDKQKKEELKERAKAKKERDKAKAQEKKQRAKDKKKRAKAKKKGKTYTPSYSKPKVEKESTPKKEKETAPKKEKESTKKEPKPKKEEVEKEEEVIEEPPVIEEVEEEAEEIAAAAEAEAILEEEKGPSEKELKKMERKASKKYVSNGLFSHDLVNYDAQMWTLRTYIDMAEYGQAATILERLEEDDTFPKRLAGEYSTLKAHYYMTRGNFGQAKQALQEAVRKVSKKEGRARLYFVLGQLEEKDQNYKEAIAAFKKSIKSKPVVYDMEFHSRINVIRSKMRNGDYGTDGAISALEKMLKDDKNEDLQDQIYFAMAEVAIEAGDLAMATEYFKKAAEVSTANDQQKALAFLRLAEIFFEKESFVQAGIFYDSTLVYLTKEYENYDEISRKKDVLSDLVAFSQAVELQDSLQQIANLPNAARVERIEELIAFFAEEAERKKQAKLAALEEAVDKKDKKNDTWIFYNPALVERGKTEFSVLWGDRPRADNWRIANKISSGDYLAGNTVGSESSGLDEAEIIAQQDAEAGVLTRDQIMAILPLTDVKMKESDQKIKDGLYGMGKIYNDKLDNPAKAKAIYEKLQTRYPDNEYAEEVLYSLYLISQKLGLTADAENYKKQLLAQHPDGKYAKIIQSPNYLDELNKQGKELQAYYEQTYQLFKQEKFEEVGKRMKEVNEKFEENALQPKFDLLAAMVVGHSQDKTNYIAALEEVVSKHPEDEVKDKANEILKYLRNQTSEASGKTAASSIYNYNPNGRHYFLVTLEGYTSKINSIINNFSDFNKGNFSADRLKVQQMLLDPENQVVLIKQFENADKAMIYYKAAKNKEVEVMQGADVGYQLFVISKSNFTQYFKNKDANAYMEFFMDSYMK